MSTSLNYDAEFSFEKSVFILKSLAQELPNVNPAITRLFASNSYRDLVNFQYNYVEGEVPRDIFMSRQALALIQKSTWICPGIDTASVALQSFEEAESNCLKTNRNFRKSASNPTRALDSALVFQVQRKISDILGPFPDLAELDFGFGPGASVGVRRLTSTRRKLSALPTCTASAWKYISYLQEAYPHWDRLNDAIPSMAGRLTFVPKNAKTDRSIVVEPLINTFLQKGVGKAIRARLKRAGCNLLSQARNQYGARKGSIDGSLCTIDLSAASDTISREVVKGLLPYGWWSFMNDVRTEEVELPNGNITRLQKFSSMGNGFTFELESLIFFAVCKVICDKGDFISVYGDDIVIPTDKYENLCQALEMFGFSVNLEKSFNTGSFRESCGKDYFGGIDVRPCYVKERLSFRELFRMHNFFVRHNEDGLANFLLQFIPTRLHHFGPDGFGDGHLLGEHPKPIHRKRDGWGGYCFRSFSAKPFQLRDELSADYSAFLLGATSAPFCEDTQCYVTSEGGSILPSSIDDTQRSSTMYFERTSTPRFRLRRIYTLGCT